MWLDPVYLKMAMLRQEIVAAVDHGPRKSLASSLTVLDSMIVMWDATQLARELLPELSLHYSRSVPSSKSPTHTLHYVVVRRDNDVIDVTESALDSWLTTNAGVQRKMQLGTALQVVRHSIESLSQEKRKSANRHLTLLSKLLDLGS